ncbi:MAG: hypothetical protein AB7T14_09440 [Candidatus Methylacidiphilaceae bacterium]
MKALLLPFFLASLSLSSPYSSARGDAWSKPASARQQFDIDFRPGSNPSPLSAENPAARMEDDAPARAYHILGMPLNAFLQAMAQRAGANYIPTPDVQGMVNSVFYDLDPVSMAKAGARVNGYLLESLDGVFVVHRAPSDGEPHPSRSAFSQRKSTAALPPPSESALSKSEAKSTPPPRQGTLPPQSSKRLPTVAGERPRPPKKLPLKQAPALSPEDKKLIALTRKLAQQKEAQKRFLQQEHELHYRIRAEERALAEQRKATEKALREQLARAKRAALEAQRQAAVE